MFPDGRPRGKNGYLFVRVCGIAAVSKCPISCMARHCSGGATSAARCSWGRLRHLRRKRTGVRGLAPRRHQASDGEGGRRCRLLLRKHFGSSVPTDSKLIFLNKVAGEDRSDEIVVDGKTSARCASTSVPRSSPSTSSWTAREQLLPVAKKGIVTVAKLTGHLKGKKISGRRSWRSRAISPKATR